MILNDGNGRLLVAGSFTQIAGTSANNIARLNADGTVDSGFNSGTGANDTINDLKIDRNGRIYLAGQFTQYNSIPQGKIARLAPDGALDTTFAPVVTDSSFATVVSIALDTTGRLLLGGQFNLVNGTPRSTLARLNSNGTLDTSFDIGTALNITSFQTVTVSTDNRPLIGGFFPSFGDLRRLNVDGTLDTTFPARISGSGQVTALALDSLGRPVVAGFFTSINGVARKGLARLSPDGNVDPSFIPGAEVTFARAIKIDGSGRILVAGGFRFSDGSGRGGVARFNTDGSLDTGFNPVVNAGVSSLAFDPSGRILIGGDFTTVNGFTRNQVARINTDGTLDSSFDPGIGPQFEVTGIAGDATGRVLIGGDFNFVSNIPRAKIARLNTDGTVDTTFTAVLDSRVNAILPLADGKILIGGRFNQSGPLSIASVVRLNPDGSIDPGFLSGGTGSFQTDGVRSLAIDSQGRIVVGGDFPFNGPINRRYFTRLLPNGSRDTSLDFATGPDNPVYGVAVDGSDRIIVAGDFLSFNGVTRFGLVRLFGDTNCSYAVSPTTPNFPASGGTTTLTVTASTGCPWTVAGTLPDWLSVNTSGGSGNGAVQLTATPNPTTSARSVSFIVAGQTIAVTQDAAVTVNSSINLVTTSAVLAPTTCGAQGYANNYVITAIVTNTGPATIYNLGFEVVELREANGTSPAVPFRLFSADGATCGSGGLVGSRQTVAAQLAPGASVTFQFTIGLSSIRRLRFLVIGVGSTVPPLANRPVRKGVPPAPRKAPVDYSRYFRR